VKERTVAKKRADDSVSLNEFGGKVIRFLEEENYLEKWTRERKIKRAEKTCRKLSER
jgi:hypothetical protein